MGHIENKIIINNDFETVFSITNNIDGWKELFSEYEESTVLEKEGNKIVFRLKTYPDKDGHFHEWVSERIIDKEGYKCVARRLEPTTPFAYMNITWLYKEVTNGIEMTWIQDFKVCNGLSWTESDFENHLTTTSKEQMKIIKTKIEQGFK